jgi:hypothetical protein
VRRHLPQDRPLKFVDIGFGDGFDVLERQVDGRDFVKETVGNDLARSSRAVVTVSAWPLSGMTERSYFAAWEIYPFIHKATSL